MSKWKTIHCQKEEVMPTTDKVLIFLSRFIMVLFAVLLIGTFLMLFTGCEEAGVKTVTETETVYVDSNTVSPEESKAYIGTWARIGNKVILAEDETFQFIDPLTDEIKDYGSYTVIVNILSFYSDQTGSTAKYILEVNGDVMTWEPDGGNAFDWERVE